MSTPPNHRRFALLDVAVKGHEISLHYALSGGPDPEIAFCERLVLPDALPAPDPREPRIAALLDLLQRTFAVSYYKVCCPAEVRAEPAPAAVADYCDLLFGQGMGEFYYQNRIDFRDRVHFPRSSEALAPVQNGRSRAPERVLVLVGGGKDSVVAREVLRHAGVDATAFSLTNAPYISASAAAMGLPHWVVGRRLDPQLFALNKRGALNGHVPISACVATVAVLCAELGGFGAVVSANERSADQGNVRWLGRTVNHQWSKSSAFEQALNDVLQARLQAAPRYLSLLRPLSELHISQLFLREPRYFDAVTSCNTNFRVLSQGPITRWCGTCPKCVFVYLMMAAHAAPATLERIFGRELLHRPENLGLLRELLGLSGKKPFECVGTFEESRAALLRLDELGRLSAPLQELCGEIRRLSPEAERLFAEEMTPRPVLDPLWQERLDAYLAAN